MKNRRGKGEGSISKRSDGRWRARLRTESGRRIELYGKTRNEVHKKLVAERQVIRDGQGDGSVGPTLKGYLAGWLDKVKARVRPSTWNRYKSVIAHVTPTLGSVRLGKLTPEHLEDLYTAKIAEGFAPRTVNHIGVVLGNALGDAQRAGLVGRNVAALAKRPRVPKKEIETLTVKQIRNLLEVSEGHRMGAAIGLACTTGMRIGEILALRWLDIDFDRGTLEVSGTLDRLPEDVEIPADADHLEGRWCRMPPKTTRSRRTLMLPANVVTTLRAHKRLQGSERSSAGELWAELDLVFANEVGGVTEPTGFRRRAYDPLIEAAEIPPTTFHALRHTAATMLLTQGVNVAVVSAMLGHALISTTLNCYAHLVPGLSEQGTAKLSDLIWNTEETPTQDSQKAPEDGEKILWGSNWGSN